MAASSISRIKKCRPFAIYTFLRAAAQNPQATPSAAAPSSSEGLRAQPVWWRGCEETRSEFPTELAWVADVERNAPAMREELLRLRDQGEEHFQPYRAPSSEQKGGRGATDRGDWNVFYLELHNMDFEAHRAVRGAP